MPYRRSDARQDCRRMGANTLGLLRQVCGYCALGPPHSLWRAFFARSAVVPQLTPSRWSPRQYSPLNPRNAPACSLRKLSETGQRSWSKPVPRLRSATTTALTRRETSRASAAQQAVEADGRASSPPAASYLSPVVMYHGLGRRFLMTPRLLGAAAA